MPFQSAFAQLFTQNVVIATVVFCLVLAALGSAVLLGWRRRRQGRTLNQPMADMPVVQTLDELTKLARR